MNAQAYFKNGLFGKDFLGSIVVFLVALPLCMGVAIASGMPPAAGLITGIVGGIIVGAIAGSPLQVSGPAAGLAVLVFELVRQHGAQALGPVILMAGVVQYIAGLCKTGVWFRMVAPSVVAGMLSGIGILIVASQLHVLMDQLPLARGLENFAAVPNSLRKSFIGEDTAQSALLVGLATIAVMVLWEKIRPKTLRFLPGALLAVVGATVVVQVFNIDVKTVDLPENLWSAVSLPNSSWLGMMSEPALIVAALTFAFIASAETLLSAAAVDRMHNGVRSDFNKEMTAQGVGNVICGFLGALPMTGVIVRSAANVQAGSATRFATMMHGMWLLVFAVALPWLIKLTPIACLAAILVYTGVKMVNVKLLKELRQYGRGTVLVYAATVIGIVATDLLTGVIIGFVLSLFRLSLLSSQLNVDIEHHDEDKRHAVINMTGNATFLKIPAMAKTFDEIPPNTTLEIKVDDLQHIDQAGVELLKDWERAAASKGSDVIIDWDKLNKKIEGNTVLPVR